MSRSHSPSYSPSDPYRTDNSTKNSDAETNGDSDMEPSSEAKRRRSQIPDRINDLPDSLLLHILSFLPIKDVIKTDILSKRWRNLWPYVPSIRFFQPYYGYDTSKVGKFVQFVNKTLALINCTKIKTFAIKRFVYVEKNAADVDLWAHFSAKNNVEELTLDISYTIGYLGVSTLYELPEHMYVNSCLKIMCLSRCNIVPSGLISWKLLKSLSIGHVKLRDDVLQNILSGSPALESLELDHIWGIRNVSIANPSVNKLVIRYFSAATEEEDSTFEILGPHLHSLEILGYFYMKCRVMNVASLVEVSLDFESNYIGVNDDNDEESQNMLIELLQSLSHVPTLTMGTWCLQALSALQLNGLLSPLSTKRKHLILTSDIGKWELPGIASLLESSFNLETIVIDMASRDYICGNMGSRFPDFKDSDVGMYWASQKRIFECLLLHLKTVKIVDYGDHGHCIIGFLQFLLKHARLLERMIIREDRRLLNMRMASIPVAQKVLSFPRSSPNAVVMITQVTGNF